MAKYRIKSPDGETFEITAPDDATQEQVLSYFQEQVTQPGPAPLSEQDFASGQAELATMDEAYPGQRAYRQRALHLARQGETPNIDPNAPLNTVFAPPETATDLSGFDNFQRAARTAATRIGAGFLGTVSPEAGRMMDVAGQQATGGFDPYTASGVAGTAAGSVVPSVLAGVLTGPTAAAVGLAASAGGSARTDIYERRRQGQEIDTTQAGLSIAGNTIAEFLGERYGLGVILKGGGPFVRRVLTSMGVNASEELSTTVMQNITQWASGIEPDKGLTDDALYSALVGAVGGTAAAAIPGQQQAPPPTPTPDAQTAAPPSPVTPAGALPTGVDVETRRAQQAAQAEQEAQQQAAAPVPPSGEPILVNPQGEAGTAAQFDTIERQTPPPNLNEVTFKRWYHQNINPDAPLTEVIDAWKNYPAKNTPTPPRVEPGQVAPSLSPRQVVDQMTQVSPKVETDPVGQQAEVQAEKAYFQGLVENLKRGQDRFVLTDVPVDKLQTINDPQHTVVAEYAEQPAETAPPAVGGVLAGGGTGITIIDGKHRVAAARARGEATIPVYVPAGDVAELGLSSAPPTHEAIQAQVRKQGVKGLPAFPALSVADPTTGTKVRAARKARKQAERSAAHADLTKTLRDVTQKITPGAVEPESRKLNILRARRLARAYEDMQHAPDDPQVQASYRAFKRETLTQFERLKEAGYTFDLADETTVPYETVDDMARDVADNKHLRVNADPGDMPLDHPLMEEAPGTGGWSHNQVFRAVHDVFGHLKAGRAFTIDGEEDAWRTHAAMYSQLARGALATETRGQSTWVGYGPEGPTNLTAVQEGRIGDVTFPAQKAGLLPDEFWTPEDTDLPADPDRPKPRSRIMRKMRDVLPDLPAVDLAAEWLSPSGTYKRPEAWIKGRRKVRAEDTIAQERAMQWANRFGKAAKQAGLDLADADTTFRIHQTLEGKAELDQWSAPVRDLLLEWRQLQDDASRTYADALDDAGLHTRAKVVRDNAGSYTKSVPRWTLTAAGRASQALKNFKSTLQHTASLKRFRRDQWTVIDARGRVQGKFGDSEQAANTFRREQGREKDWKVVPPRTVEERAEEDIHDPRYLLMAGLGEATHDAQIVRLHSFVAEQYATRPPEGVTGDQITEWAANSDLVPMPHHGRYHNLQNVYVPEHIAADLTEMVDVPTGLEALLRGYMKMWKKGVIVYNPATHGRNLLGNGVFFSTLARTSPANPANWKHYSSGWNAIAEKGPLWEEMVQQDVLGGEYYGTEINALKDQLSNAEYQNPGSLLALLSKADRKIGRVYALEDQVFKAAAYMKYREQGMTPEAAGVEVNKWFPNYDRTSKLTKWMASKPFGMPFASFFDQSLRITGRAVAERPFALTALFAMPGVVDWVSRIMAGISEEEEKILRSNQSYMERYFTPFLPWRDSNGKPLSFDLRYTLPLANDLLPQMREHGALYMPWFANGPLATSFVEFMSGHSQFTGRQFETVGERAGAVGANLIPIPSLIKYGPQRITKAATGTSRSIPEAVTGAEPGDPLDEKLREDTAYAVMGVVTGLNVRRPYAGERDVLDAAAAAKQDGDLPLATAILRKWNQDYRPRDRKPLTMKKVNSRIARKGK